VEIKKVIPSLSFISAVVVASAFAGPEGQHSLAAAETLLVRQDYNAARRCVSAYLRQNAEDDYALYLRVAIEQTALLDYEFYTTARGDRFIKMADSIRTVLEGRLPQLGGRDSTLCLLYIANIYGGISVIKAKRGVWFPALKNSLVSVGLLKEAVQRDSSLYAALLGIGTFHYYLSKAFIWLPFIDEGSGERGVREIEQAMAAPFPFNFGAKNTLCWILVDRRQFERADSVALTALQETPGSTVFLRIRCLIAFWSGHYERAIELGMRLSERSLMRDPVNWSDYVMAYYVLAGSYDALGKVKEALAAVRHIMGTKIPPGIRKIPTIRKNINRILDIKNECLQ
jgi:tetratricopeptide (TPR) repeat protein